MNSNIDSIIDDKYQSQRSFVSNNSDNDEIEVEEGEKRKKVSLLSLSKQDKEEDDDVVQQHVHVPSFQIPSLWKYSKTRQFTFW